jgi:ABC-type multidrug transport system fused ATPase/permease subunit
LHSSIFYRILDGSLFYYEINALIFPYTISSYRYKRQLLESGILKLLNTLVQFIPSLLIARILKHVDKAAAARTLFSTAKFTLIDREGMVLALALYGTLCVKTFLENQYFDAIIAIGATARGSISSAIFRKSLKLSPAGRQNNTMGEIVNYMQLDTSRMESVIGTLHVCWDGPLQVLGYTALLLKFLGPSVLAGIAAMLVIIPFNAIYLKKLSALRAINLKYTDSRVKLTNEILQGVRAIKSYNWEKPFVEKLTAVRDLELNALEASANTRAILTSVLTAAPSMVAVITLGTYGLLGNVLTPTKVFTALALFNQLRFPLVFLPLLLNNLAEGRVSLYRLTKFLLTDEVQDYVQRKKESDIVLDNISSPGVSGVKDSDAILIEQGSFSWNSDPDSHTNNDVIKSIDNDGVKTTVLNGVQTGAIKVQNGVDIANRGVLSNVNLRIKKGELVAIIGMFLG